MQRPALVPSCLRLAAALALAAAVAPPGRAATPEARCQKATVSALAACASKLGAAELGCFKKTGAACADGDRKVARALAGLSSSLGKKCPDAASVEAAGFAPLLPDELAARFQDACTRAVDDIAARAFGGAQGPLLAGAAPADAKCLLLAGGEAGKLLARSLDTAGRCAGKVCTAAALDDTADRLAQLESKAAAKLERKCADLEGLVGLAPPAFAREAAERAADAAAAPCDPLDPAHCLFPFSNDYFSVGDVSAPSGRRLSFARDAMPTSVEGVGAIQVDPQKWNRVDGFSVGPTLLFQNEQLDLAMSAATPLTDLGASLEADAGVVILDAETGAQQLLWVERDAKGTGSPEQVLIGRVGANLENGRRYLVAVRGAKDAAGNLLTASPAFAAYRDRTPSPQLPVEARRPHMERIFGELEGFGVARESLYLAWDFTTQSVESTSAKLLHMRDDAFDQILGSAAPTFEVTTVVDAPNAGIFRRVEGTVQVPLYLTGDGAPGSELRLGADGLPVNEGDFFSAGFLCLIPEAATTAGGPPAIPARPALYGHGLLGSRGETGAGHVRGFANAHNFIMCGTDWTGFSEEDLVTVLLALNDFSNFPRFIERQLQGILNFLVLGRALKHPQGFASHAAFQIGDGESLIDPSGLFYDGNSQGGILGGVLAAFAQDITRFVLGVPGINYSTLLDRSKDFTDFNAILEGIYTSRVDRVVLIAMAQLLWDQTDPSGHVRHTTSDPYPNTPAKKILYQVAFGDHQVAPVTVEIAARSNGAHIHTPVVEPGKLLPELTPYYGIPAIPSYPFDGSAVVIWDSGNPAPPIENVPPPRIFPEDPEWADLLPCAQNPSWESDPHECPRRQPEAREQKSEFLKNDGAVVDVCGGMACLAPSF
jgi:hypothetical protein